MRMFFASLVVMLVTACYHPLEIVGEGDIISSTGTHDCSLEEQPCQNELTGDYYVTYTAQPREGWQFVGWEGCSSELPTCSFGTSAAWVEILAGITAPTLRAIFEEVPTTPYNVVLVMADDLSYDHYSFAGHPYVQTPSIDALAAQSVHYSQAYVSSACRATMATLMTGLPEHQHGVTYISGPQLGAYSTVGDRLMGAGYTTLQAGKFWEGNPASRGFVDYLPFTGVNGNLSIGRTSLQPMFDLMEQASPPWFLWFTPYMPHSPHEAPAEYIALYQGLGLDDATIEFFAMISWFDARVGELLLEVDDNTIVVFLADNGYVQSPIAELYMPRSKTSLYEQGIRTPLLIRHPDWAPEVRTDLVNAVDVTATILEMGGAFREDLPGRNVLTAPPAQSSAQGSRSSLGIGSPGGVLKERWMRQGDWKLVDVVNGENRLFDLGLDPGENTNLVDAPEWSSLMSQLLADLDAWWLE